MTIATVVILIKTSKFNGYSQSSWLNIESINGKYISHGDLHGEQDVADRISDLLNCGFALVTASVGYYCLTKVADG